jgi:hypothetical protein
MDNEWKPVVFAADCIYEEWDEFQECPICPVCKTDYADCECPGPMQEDEFEYKEIDGQLYARPIKEEHA